MNDAARVSTTWDVHIAHLPPQRWNELAHHDADALQRITGQSAPPTIVAEDVAWEDLHITPRWLGDDSSRAVAALQPRNVAGRGADEWRRFYAGAAARGEIALAISMIGTPKPPKTTSFFGADAGVSLPDSAQGWGSVHGKRITLAAKPTITEGVNGADRDLASRIVTTRDVALPWWALSLHGAQVSPGRGGPSIDIAPSGTLTPLLSTGAGEVVAAVWTSSDDAIRHYIVPWLPGWKPLLEWLGRQAIPEFIPSAARRIRATLREEPRLQTTAELAAQSALAALEHDYQIRHGELTQQLAAAREAADDIRHDMLFGSSAVLVNAVSRVLTDAGCDVTPLDELLGRTANADLLVAHGGRRRLVEVKRESGNAAESLVYDAHRHLDTWPQLRPDIQVEGVTLIVNHQTNTHPLIRSAAVYSRPEFVQSLTIPVIATLELFDAWRNGDFDAIRNAVFPPAARHRLVSEATPARESAPTPTGRARRRRRWRG